MSNTVPPGYTIQFDKAGTKFFTVGTFDAINKSYSLLDEHGKPVTGTYKKSAWWNPQPPSAGAGKAPAKEPAPKRATPKATTPKATPAAAAEPAPLAQEQSLRPESKQPSRQASSSSSSSARPAKKTIAKPAPRKAPLPRGTIIKLDKKGTVTAMIGDYDMVSKRYTLYGKASEKGGRSDKRLPGSYEYHHFWDPVAPS